MRTLLTTILVAGLLMVGLGGAAAAPADCHGRTATITSDGGPVIGTEGEDVISTTGAVHISALGGDDLICVTVGSAVVDGGTGSDSLVVLGPDTDAERWAVDLAGIVRRAATTVITFAGLETYSLDFGRPVEVEVQGTDGDDVIELVGGQYDAKLGAGRDRFIVGGYEFSGTIDAGEGTDAIWALDPARIIIDLGKQGAVAMGGETFGVDNFEDAIVVAYRVEVRGSRAVNTLDLSGCIVHGYGRGGDDLLILGKRAYEVACTRRNLNLDGEGGDDRLIGSNLGDVLSGGKGNDVLKGLQGRDELLGGAGGDKTDGGGGRDKCEAEVKVKCEVKA